MSRQRNSIFAAFAAFLSVWILAVLCGINWETNDDMEIAYLISQTASGGTIFQHKLLVIILHAFYSAIPSINHWLIFSLFMISAGYAASIFAISKYYPKLLGTVLSLVLLVMLKRYVLDGMNLSRTAAVALGGGMMLVIDATQSDDFLKKPFKLFTGVLVMILGASARMELAWPAVSFLVTVSLATAIVEKRIKKMGGLLFCCALLAGFVLLNSMLLSSAEKSFLVYNGNRSLLSDNMDKMPGYDDDDAVYKELGLSRADFDCLTSWITEDTEVFSPSVLDKIGQTKRTSINLGLLAFKTRWAFWLSMRYPDAYYLVILSGVTALIGAIGAENRKRNWFPIVCCIACFCALYVFLVWYGRIATRVTFGLLWMLICSLLMFPPRKADGKFGFPAILLAVSLIWSGICLYNGNIGSVPWKNSQHKAELRTEIFDVIDSDTDNIYIFPMTGINIKSCVIDDWAGYPEDYCDNLFYLGGWSARCPYNIEKLAQYGISNPMHALFEDDNVYSCRGWITNEILLFLQSHYDKNIKIETTGTIGELEIIKFCR